MSEIEAPVGLIRFLHRLGVTENYTGFHYLVCAVCLCIAEPERLLQVTKRVYPEVADRYHTNWKAVERNIRTAARVIWEQGRMPLEHLAGRALLRRPRTAQLLAILTYGLLPHVPFSETAPEALFGDDFPERVLGIPN